VGERVGGDVDDPHDEAASGPRQLGDPGDHGVASSHARYRPRMTLIASARVAAFCMPPRTAELTVREPGLRTPRIDVHRCSHSTTTMTPRGSRMRTRASAICVVSRSWTCGRLA